MNESVNENQLDTSGIGTVGGQLERATWWWHVQQGVWFVHGHPSPDTSRLRI